MLITAAQMAVFQAQAPRNFAKRLAAHLEPRFAGQMAHSGERVPNGAVLFQAILDLVSAAQTFGISSELGVGQFVTIGLGYSRKFYEDDSVASMLQDLASTADQNIQRVLNCILVIESRGNR